MNLRADPGRRRRLPPSPGVSARGLHDEVPRRAPAHQGTHRRQASLGELVYLRAQLSCWYPPIEGRVAAATQDGRRRRPDRHGHASLRFAGTLRRAHPAHHGSDGPPRSGLRVRRRLDHAAGVQVRRARHGGLLLLHSRRSQPDAAGDLRFARRDPHRRHHRPRHGRHNGRHLRNPFPHLASSHIRQLPFHSHAGRPY